MTKQQDLTADEPKEDISEEAQGQVASEEEGEGYEEPDDDDSPELRLQALTAEYARERAALAEQISQLQEESDRLKHRIQELECSGAWPLAGLAVPSKEDQHPERAIGLDFSLPEDRNKE